MDHATSCPPVRQVAQHAQQLVQQPGLPFAPHLSQQAIHDAVRQAGGRFRDRIFSPAVTLWTFLSQVFDADHSCRQAVARLLAFRVAQGQAPCSADTGAYCKARQRFPEPALAALVRQSGQRLAENSAPAWLWKERPVKLVDGSGLSMPDTEDNQQDYPKQRHLPPGVGFPLMRLVVVFSLEVGTVLDAAVGPFRGKHTGELSLFRRLDAAFQPGDVVVADRLYANFWDVARLHQRGIDVVLRMHASRTKVWFRGRGRSRANRRVWWRKPERCPDGMAPKAYDALPEWLCLRALRVDVRQRFRTRQLVLVTTLTDAQAYPAADVAELYRRRWQAELRLRSLKTHLQMAILRGKTPDVVRKEVWAHLLVYNLVRGLMAQAAVAAGRRPDAVSFTGALQSCNAFLPSLLSATSEAESAQRWQALLTAISRHRVGDRPDRCEPRVVRYRKRKFRQLKMTRVQAHRCRKKGGKFPGEKA